MKKGKVIHHEIQVNTARTSGEFSINFSEASFWPYRHIFTRENLYFDEDVSERWSYFFPMKSLLFQNTEIFLETNNIVVWVWKRWSFSGKSKLFVEVVNLKTAAKYRLYPDEVSLIYNQKDSIVTLEINSLEKVSETSEHLSAFFKLVYSHTSWSYGRLMYKANSKSHMAWYFQELSIENQDIENPINFRRNDFVLETKDGSDIDVWEASLTWKIVW